MLEIVLQEILELNALLKMKLLNDQNSKRFEDLVRKYSRAFELLSI